MIKRWDPFSFLFASVLGLNFRVWFCGSTPQDECLPFEEIQRKPGQKETEKVRLTKELHLQ